MGVKARAERWQRAIAAARPGERAAATRLAAIAGEHASEGFYAFDDPFEAAVVSALVALARPRGAPSPSAAE